MNPIMKKTPFGQKHYQFQLELYKQGAILVVSISKDGLLKFSRSCTRRVSLLKIVDNGKSSKHYLPTFIFNFLYNTYKGTCTDE